VTVRDGDGDVMGAREVPGGGARASGAPEAGSVDAGVRVRRMEPGDLDRVMEIERASFTMPWTLETFRGLLRRPDSVLWVAERVAPPVREVVGYAAVWIVVDQAELGDIAVEEAWRGRGIGRQLLDTVINTMAARGVRELYLEVRVGNHGAQRLYERFGFVRVGRRKDYYSEPREDALVLRRLIAR
jgi:[ribosomal protein S18]-alanine N-acetyltransferase